MTFTRLTPDSIESVVAFIRRYGDAFMKMRAENPETASQMFNGRDLYGRYDEGRLATLIVLTVRTHLTWQGRMYFPFVIGPDITPERKRAVLAEFLPQWRAEETLLWRRMIIYDDTPGEDEAPYLKAWGFAFVRRHMKYLRGLDGGLPPAGEFPRVEEALAKGYSVTVPTAAEIEADPILAERLVAVRNATFAVRDNIDQWTVAEMLRQLRLPGAFATVLWHDGAPVGLSVIFIVEEGDDKGEAYVSEIVVHRRHWGKVAADLLGYEMLRESCARGALAIAGVADETNRPSRNLMERFGLTVRNTSSSWTLDLPPAASR